MAERSDQWPRVHTCLYDWCPKQSDECKRCDAVVEVHRKAIAERAARQPEGGGA